MGVCVGGVVLDLAKGPFESIDSLERVYEGIDTKKPIKMDDHLL